MVASSITNGLNPLASPLTLFIVQLLLIVVLSRALNYFLSYIKQPPVISEVITGVVLGPSVLGQSKVFNTNVFPASSMTVLNVIANVGLIFFMFMIGLEVEAGVLKRNLKSSLIISLTSIIIPFAMGIGLSALLFHYMVADGVQFGIFSIFVGVAISITAFPVLARILTERKIMHSKVGVTALAAASVDDVIAWILLAVVVSYAKNTTSGDNSGNLTALWTFLLLAGFVVFMFVGVRKALLIIYTRWVKTEAQKHNMIIFLLMCMFASAFYTEVIGVHAIFGGFILGICVPRVDGFHMTITERIEDIVTIVLLPLYFTFSGLRTNLSSINSGTAGGLTIFIIFIACFGKIGGATLASRFTKNTWRESITVGFLMNTKGLVELIVLNIGLDIGVLDQTLFTMFVVMALVTTFMTTPVVHFVWTKWEDAQKRLPMVPRKDGKFKLLMYVNQTRIGAAMANIAGAITPPQGSEHSKKYMIKGIFINQASDGRPSTYFFNNVSNLPPQRKEAFLAVESESKNIGYKVKPIVLNSEDASEDICCVAKRSWPDFVLLGFSKESSTQPLSISMDHIGQDQLNYGKSIIKVLQNVKSCVGVIVDRGLDRFYKQHEILFIYTGQEYEEDAITILFKMARRPNISVTCITSHAEIITNKVSSNPKLDLKRFNIISSQSPTQDLLQKVEDEQSNLWLVVMGLPREQAISHEQLINATTVSLLFIYPANTLLEITNKGSSLIPGNLSSANLQELDPESIEIELQTPKNI
ncbi:Na+/H+ antiporter [Tieghemostelium lacteum]|uniref:Na+/H+ antiporter n=1 Tax=Tieghemostelium lacteum TaxID=361077 RepID=A0A151ZFQ7_TIELA|nr:Na+/H+ antiporter [Tieghemostelium lacteum]|eukprot:KYQ92700.1 Na+/H+ antiporter [Tieghemostelium lacteum]